MKGICEHLEVRVGLLGKSCTEGDLEQIDSNYCVDSRQGRIILCAKSHNRSRMISNFETPIKSFDKSIEAATCVQNPRYSELSLP